MLSQKCRRYRRSAHLAKSVISGIKTRKRPFNPCKLRLCLRKHLAPPFKHGTIAGEIFKRLAVKFLRVCLEHLRYGGALVERPCLFDVLLG